MSNPKTPRLSEHRRRSQQTFMGKSLTQQHPAKESDINHIVKRYLPTGALPSHGKNPIYGDFSSVDFMTMQNQIADIEHAFARLPARLRGRFRNDPYQLLRFVEDQKNHPEAVRLGLLIDPTKPAGEAGYDPVTGLAADDQVEPDPLQVDAMSQLEILNAMDPDHESYDEGVKTQLQESAKGGDAESRSLLELAAATSKKRAARPAKRPQAKPKKGS